MDSNLYVSINGVVKEANGPQPIHALLFVTPSKKVLNL